MGARCHGLTIKEECRHAGYPLGTGFLFVACDLRGAEVGLEKLHDTSRIETGGNPDFAQNRTVADILSVDKIRLKEAFDHLVLKPSSGR